MLQAYYTEYILYTCTTNTLIIRTITFNFMELNFMMKTGTKFCKIVKILICDSKQLISVQGQLFQFSITIVAIDSSDQNLCQ